MQEAIIKVLMWIIKTLSAIFIQPIVLLVSNFIPDLNNFISVCQEFLGDYVFKGALFVKQAFVNCTGVSQVILASLFTYLALKVALWVSLLTYKLIIKIWKLVKP